MEPVKVKAYGILELTKKQYLTIQAIGFSLMIVLFVGSFFITLKRFPVDTIRLIIGGVVILEIAETYFMMRAFRRKEASASNSSIPELS